MSPDLTPICTTLHEGSELKTQVYYIARAQLAMRELGTSTQTIFCFGVFFWIFFPFFTGLVLADRSPPSPRVEFLSAFSCCCVNYTQGC